ncbi:MAG TPA: hypothetical protein VF816_04835 [Rhodocyclaceae bacterium]
MITETRTLCLLLSSTLLLAACDVPFLNDEEAKIEARRQAEGQAIGSGCRYSSRSLEDCYGLNPKTSKAAILAGWRDMDAYMRENNIVVAGPAADGGDNAKPVEAKPKAEAEPAAEAPKAAEAAPPVQAAPKKTQGAQGVNLAKPSKHMV